MAEPLRLPVWEFTSGGSIGTHVSPVKHPETGQWVWAHAPHRDQEFVGGNDETQVNNFANHLGLKFDQVAFDKDWRSWQDQVDPFNIDKWRGQPVHPHHVWLHTDGAEGEPPPIHQVDWRPTESTPEDFYTYSKPSHTLTNQRSGVEMPNTPADGENASQTQYADHETVNALLHELSQPHHAEHRWGHDDPLQGHRGVTADALEEMGRGTEANLLRSPGHVIVHQGQVHPGRFTDRHIRSADIALHNRLWNDSNGRFTEDHGYTQLGNGRGSFFFGDYPETEHHMSQLGHAIADHVEDRLMDADQTHPDLVANSDYPDVSRLIHNVRTAPFEEPVPQEQPEHLSRYESDGTTVNYNCSYSFHDVVDLLQRGQQPTTYDPDMDEGTDYGWGQTIQSAFDVGKQYWPQIKAAAPHAINAVSSWWNSDSNKQGFADATPHAQKAWGAWNDEPTQNDDDGGMVGYADPYQYPSFTDMRLPPATPGTDAPLDPVQLGFTQWTAPGGLARIAGPAFMPTDWNHPSIMWSQPNGEDYNQFGQSSGQEEPTGYADSSATHEHLPAMIASIAPGSWRGDSWHDQTNRLVASDYLRDLGMEREANLLGARDAQGNLKHLYKDFGGAIEDAGELSRQVHQAHAAGTLRHVIDPFTESYIRTHLFAGTDDEGNPLDANHDLNSIHPSTLAAMIADSHHFRADHGDDQMQSRGQQDGGNLALSRNGHGTGFFDDESLEPEDQERLQTAARNMGEYNLHVGDDGMVHGDYEVHPNQEQQQYARSDYFLPALAAAAEVAGPMIARSVATNAAIDGASGMFGGGEDEGTDYGMAQYGDEEDNNSFLHAIHSNPLDATNHLVHADWLEERGDHGEAAFRRAMGSWLSSNPKVYPPELDRGFNSWSIPVGGVPKGFSEWELRGNRFNNEHRFNDWGHLEQSLRGAFRIVDPGQIPGAPADDGTDWQIPGGEQPVDFAQYRADQSSWSDTGGSEFAAYAAEPTNYSHEAFQGAIQQDPTDAIARGVYADWLEENAPDQAHPDTLNFLRTYGGPAWAAHHPQTGELVAGPHHSWDDIRKANGEEYRWQQKRPGEPGYSPNSGEHFGFFREFTEPARTPMARPEDNLPELTLSGHPHSGPGGTHFVTQHETGPHQLWTFNPQTGGVQLQSRAGLGEDPNQAHELAHRMSQGIQDQPTNASRYSKIHSSSPRDPSGWGEPDFEREDEIADWVSDPNPHPHDDFPGTPSQYAMYDGHVTQPNYGNVDGIMRAVPTSKFLGGKYGYKSTAANYGTADEEPTEYAGPYTHEDFLNRIAENPQEAVPGHAYADWLDEQGHYDQAAVVRAHVMQHGTGAREALHAGTEQGGSYLHGGPRRGGNAPWNVQLSTATHHNPDYPYGGLQWEAQLPRDQAHEVARSLLGQGAIPQGGSYWQEGYDSLYGTLSNPHERIYDQAPPDPERLSRYESDWSGSADYAHQIPWRDDPDPEGRPDPRFAPARTPEYHALVSHLMQFPGDEAARSAMIDHLMETGHHDEAAHHQDVLVRGHGANPTNWFDWTGQEPPVSDYMAYGDPGDNGTTATAGDSQDWNHQPRDYFNTTRYRY